MTRMGIYLRQLGECMNGKSKAISLICSDCLSQYTNQFDRHYRPEFELISKLNLENKTVSNFIEAFFKRHGKTERNQTNVHGKLRRNVLYIKDIF